MTRTLYASILGILLVLCPCTSRGAPEVGASTQASANGVNATLTLTTDWGSGYCADVTLQNTSAAAVTSWTVVVDLNQGTLSQLWNGVVTRSGTQITVKPAGAWNSTLAPGAAQPVFGFCGSGAGASYQPTLVSLSIDGASGGEPSEAAFAIAASPATVAVSQGASTTSAISLIRTGGFADSVVLSASVLPSGVTASFDPASTTGDSSTLTLTASGTAATGTAALTVTATGGGLTRSASINLTVSSGSASTCGTVTNNPFGDCKFSWGAPDDGSNSSYLSFVSGWIGYETRGGLDAALATNVACDGCRLAKAVASTKAMAVFYTYFIGFQANYMGGFGDCNVDHDGHNLCTDGAQWIRDNRALIVNMYGEYAKKVHAASPNKPVIWWLEGDFVQYSYSDQSNPLSYAELGALARDITCAIKSNQPNAVVAMNHSPWISNDQANGFWGAQPLDVLDLVWVQGAGDTDTFVNSGTYNAATANFGWLHRKTGRKIMAETSFAGSGSADRWSTTTAANINARIANGVIGVLVNNPGASYQSATDTLGPSLSSTCN
ncbi:MAG: hypothetical protein A2V77_16725 [Anaeromyxobacter sp. RBG_16_69_14]|nr:MAG: hypothetical protein A2V77_16725 [Anaeromyxobacter sp. RBG_16_69_14]